jgi:hypothetical protein
MGGEADDFEPVGEVSDDVEGAGADAAGGAEQRDAARAFVARGG